MNTNEGTRMKKSQRKSPFKGIVTPKTQMREVLHTPYVDPSIFVPLSDDVVDNTTDSDVIADYLHEEALTDAQFHRVAAKYSSWGLVIAERLAEDTRTPSDVLVGIAKRFANERDSDLVYYLVRNPDAPDMAIAAALKGRSRDPRAAREMVEDLSYAKLIARSGASLLLADAVLQTLPTLEELDNESDFRGSEKSALTDVHYWAEAIWQREIRTLPEELRNYASQRSWLRKFWGLK